MLSKIERNHAQDQADVQQFLERGLVTRAQIAAYFEAIAPQIYRYPALDAAAFRQRVRDIVEAGDEVR